MLTLSDPTRPNWGSSTSWSHAETTRGRRPFPSTRAPARRGPSSRARRRRPPPGRPPRRRSRPPPASRVSEPVGQVADPGHRKVLDGAGRRLGGRGCDLGGAALGDHDPRRSRRLGNAAHGAQVVRVLHLVECDDQRLLVREQPGRVRVGVAVGLGADALVVGDCRHAPRSRPRRRCAARLPRPASPRTSARPPWPTRAGPRAGGRAAPRAPGCGRRGSPARTSRAPSGVSRTSQPAAASSSRSASARAKSRSARACSRCSSRRWARRRARRRRRRRAGSPARARAASRPARRTPSRLAGVEAAVGLRHPLEQDARGRRGC